MTEQDRNEAMSNETPVESGTRQAPERMKPRALPLWKVLLHNDDINEITDVVKTVRRLTPLNAQEAQSRIEEAHQSGLALLLVTHQERAELYVEQFASCNLTVSIEPDA